MNRPTFWAWSLSIIAVGFFLGYLFPRADTLHGLYQLLAIVVMWIIGVARVQDAGFKHTAWAFFAPTIVGMIIFGSYPTKEKTDVSQ